MMAMAAEKNAEPAHVVEHVPGLDDLADALRDLCTVGELEALAHRWQIAELVDSGRSYLDIADAVHTSTATVTRVAHWLRHGAGGYALALERTARRREG